MIVIWAFFFLDSARCWRIRRA